MDRGIYFMVCLVCVLCFERGLADDLGIEYRLAANTAGTGEMSSSGGYRRHANFFRSRDYEQNVSLSHFYQHLNYDGHTSWHVTTLNNVISNSSFHITLSVARSDLKSKTNMLYLGTSNRIGAQIRQSLSKNESVYVGMKVLFGGAYFPKFSCRGGYTSKLDHGIGIDLGTHIIYFRDGQMYSALLFTLSKNYSAHHVSVGADAGVAGRFVGGGRVCDELSLFDGDGALRYCLAVGYLHNENIFIDYKNMGNSRFSLSSEGEINLRRNKGSLVAGTGVEYFKKEKGKYTPNFFIHLGVNLIL